MVNISGMFTLTEFFGTVQELTIFVIGMILYSIFIYKFYKLISKRDLFDLNLQGRTTSKIFSFLLYILEYLIIFPIVVFLWFSIISTSIVLISETQTISEILLMSMALTAAVRITSYYNENISQEIAKLLPFVLLGVFLVDVSVFSLERSIETAMQITTIWKQPIYYLFFVIGFEFILRISTFVSGSAFKVHVSKEEIEKAKEVEEAIKEEKKKR